MNNSRSVVLGAKAEESPQTAALEIPRFARNGERGSITHHFPSAQGAMWAPGDPAAPSPAIALRAFRVGCGRVTVAVEIADPTRRTTNDALAALALQAYPDLAAHACVNGEGPRFGDVMARTSVPHLLEHIVISLQTRASSDAGARFVGSTDWVDEGAGIARVQVSFADDLQALHAFGEATRFLNNAVLRCAP